MFDYGIKSRNSEMACLDLKNRTTFICAANQEAEEAFKKTVEIDRLIDMLREANPREVRLILSF